MTKKILLSFLLTLTTCYAFSQRQSGFSIGYMAGQGKIQNGVDGDGEPLFNTYSFSTGLPIVTSPVNVNKTITAGFPYPILYFSETFGRDFFVSKGFFPDAVELRWELANSGELIDRFLIYRKPLDSESDSVLVATLPADQFAFRDTQIEGGLLYKYTLFAQGVNDDLRLPFINILESTGFAFPVGIATGRVTFSGGTAVEGVSVVAETDGNLRGRSMFLDGDKNAYLRFFATQDDEELSLDEGFTFQMWARYTAENNERGSLFNKGTGIDLSYDGNNLYFILGDQEAVLPFENPVDSFFHVSAVYNPGAGLIELYARTTDFDETKVRIPSGSKPSLIFSDPFLFGRGRSKSVPFTGYIDEMRLWNKPLDSATIARDYSRFIFGNEEELGAYWRLNAGIATDFYDLSREGRFNFNENHGQIIRGEWSDESPLKSQLAHRGVTDNLGNYSISGFPFESSGSQYTFTPILNNHSFEPFQQLRFVGNNESIFNGLDFNDISSFPVSGTIFYDNTPFPVEGISVLVDGVVSVDREGNPVVTDDKGEFSVEVPIGFHSLRVIRPTHNFEGEGRFPELVDGSDDIPQFNFQQPLSGLVFQDQTLVKLSGRVAGGPIEQGKLLGFGLSKNNIGNGTIILRPTKLADLTFEEADSTVVNTEDKFKSDVTFNVRDITIKPDSLTGEYSAFLPPEQYAVLDVFTSNYNFDDTFNTTVNLFNPSQASEIRQDTVFVVVEQDTIFANLPFDPLDFDSVFQVASFDTLFTVAVDTFKFGSRKDFILRLSPQIFVTNEDNEFVFGDSVIVFTDENLGIREELQLIDRANADSIYTLGHPVFVQRNSYTIKTRLFEEYEDEEGNFDRPPVVDGEIAITNELAIRDEEIRLPLNSRGEARYTFTAGLPNISLDEGNPENSYTKTFNITAFSGENGAIRTLWRDPSNPFRGIVFGGLPTGSNFVTTGPNEILTILRDPPGGGSSAFIEEGNSVSRATSWNVGGSLGRSLDVTTTVGTSVTTFQGAGIGAFVGTINEASSEFDVATGISSELSFATENTTVNTTTFSRTISTSDSEDFVGADGDLFVGFSTNIVYGRSRNLGLVPESDCLDDNCLDTNVSGFKLGIEDGLRLNPEFETFFVFSQFTVENITVPSLQNIRNEILRFSSQPDTINPISEPAYISLIAPEDERFGSDNYDESVWGDDATTDVGDGPSYVIKLPQAFIDENRQVNDTILFFNQQIAEWNYWLTHNERVKVQAEQGRNITFDGGATIEESEEVAFEDGNVREFNFVVSSEVVGTADTDASLFGVAVGFELSSGVSAEVSTGRVEVVTEETSTTYGFTLDDGDLGDTYTVDIKDPSDGFGPVFSTRGGATSCPYEDVVVTKYFQPGTEISTATAQREVPELNIESNLFTDIPSNREAAYTLLIRNNSETDEGFEMELDIVDGTNPDGAVIKIDGAPLGNGLVFNVPAGQTLTKTLTLGKGREDVNDYENIGIVLRSLCQADPNDNRDDIEDTAFISAFFQPGCSDISMIAPIDNWVLNTRNPIEDVLSVTIADYDLNLETFERVDFQYRASSSSVWITEMKFYNPRQVTAEEFEELDEPKTMIEGATISYAFDMSSLPDREYDVQAVSTCVLGPGNEVVTPTRTYRGTKDTKRPLLFGAPQPADGVLSANDDISIQFDETIEAALLSNANLSVKGVLNNAELTNGVSVNFDGINDYMRIPGGLDLSGRSFTIFSWLRRQSFDKRQILYSKGTNANDVFEYGFNEANRFFVNISGQEIQSSIAFPETVDRPFENIAVIYDIEKKEITAIRNGEFILENVPLESSFTGRGAIALGMSQITNNQYFDGKMHELRIWTQTKSLGDIASRANISLSGREIGLAGYWPMDEAFGDLAIDKARFRNAIVYADWNVEPKGFAFKFDGVDDFVSMSTGSTVNITSQTDFSVEFWFKGEPGQREIVFFSNGKGDSTQEAASSADTWFVGINNSEELVISNSQNEIVVVEADKSVLDNDWHHFAMALSRRGNINAYIDQQLQVSVSSEGLGALTESRMWLGARGFRSTNVVTTFDRHFNGYIDEFRIWNSFRRQSQIELNWNCKLIGDEIGLVAYYPFDDFRIRNGINVLEASLEDQFINEFGDNGGLAFAGGGSDFEEDDTPNVKLARPVQSIDFDFAVNDDELIITPNPTFAPLIEESVLDISVRVVEDLFENRLISPVSWTAFVDRNQVNWGDEKLVFSKEVNKSFTFTVEVINSGGTEQSFSIDNLPPWLVPSQAAGTITPQSSLQIEFSVDAGLNIGGYEEDIFLSADLGFNEKLNLSLDVFGAAPAWEVNPEQFQFTMNIVGELTINDVKSYDVDDIIAVFVDDEVRGFAQPQYIQDLDRYLVFMDVYSNNSGEDSLEFRVWDASVGQELRNVLPNLTFNSNEVFGSPKDPLQIIAGNTLVLEIDLNAGWNWLSFNVDGLILNDIDELMKPIQSINGDQFKGHTLVDVFTDGVGWKGTLSNAGGAKVGSMYQVKVGSNGILPVVGTLAPDDTEIQLLEGWNWIGFIPNFNISVDEAFGSVSPDQGDIVKSQFAFSVFDEGIGWEGTLSFLEPGKGYLYQSGKDATLIYPENSILNSRSSRDNQEDKIPWNIQRQKFSSNMTMIAQLENADSDSVIIGAFNNDEFRGGGVVKEVGGKKLYFITISGEQAGDAISFQAYDQRSGEVFGLKNGYEFKINQTHGSIDNPIILELDKTISGLSTRPTISPNPSSLSFYLTLPEAEGDYQIDIIDIQGQIISSKKMRSGEKHLVQWNDHVIPGIYFVSIVSNNSNEKIKVIKK